MVAVGEMLLGFGRAGTSSKHCWRRAVSPLCVVVEQHSVNRSISEFSASPDDANGYLEAGWDRAGWHCGLTAKEHDKILACSNARGEKIREKPDKRTKILKTMAVCHQEWGLFAPLAAV